MNFVKYSKDQWVNLDLVVNVNLGVKERWRGDPPGPDEPILRLYFNRTTEDSGDYVEVKDPFYIEKVITCLTPEAPDQEQEGRMFEEDWLTPSS